MKVFGVMVGMLLAAGAAQAVPVAGGILDEVPVTRQEFAMELVPLVRDWEARRVLRPSAGPSINTFVDLDATARPVILDLANRYHLFVGVPSLSGDRFGGSMPLNRSEAALILGQLLEPLRTAGVPAQAISFTDLASGDGQRFGEVFRLGVMEGFPDKTFRAYEPLTRGQLNLVLAKLKALPTLAPAAPATASPNPVLKGFEPSLLDAPR